MPSRTAKAQAGSHHLTPRSPRAPGSAHHRPGNLRALLGLLAFVWAAIVPARAALQFDVFAGFDDTVREANWFPVTFEAFNDGPSFNGVIEFSSGQIGSGQARRVAVELPTNSRKRIVLPAFASSRFGTWDARLLDEKGRVRAEKLNIRLSNILAPSTFLLAAVPKSQGGRPEFPRPAGGTPDRAPRVVRLTSELVPDHPIAMEGVHAFYLSSERAVELKAAQISALITWIYQGGHLILGVEQAADLSAAPWLRRLIPMEITGSSTHRLEGAFTRWLRSQPEAASITGQVPRLLSPKQPRPSRNRNKTQAAAPAPAPAPAEPSETGQEFADDPAFDRGEIVLATGKTVGGASVPLSVGNDPAVATIDRGRGRVSLLTFSPDREPFRSWSNRTWFWSQLVGIPARTYSAPNENVYPGMGSDGIFGAIIDSRQVRKLPIEWLLLLLLVYLVVIGPLDQYWLKKINRQMLTWVTFPAYVAFFSVLIYFIASKLRAGEMEWNELHVVDVIRHGERADLRGRSFSSIYSPVNAKYSIAATNHGFATLRGEFHGSWGAGQDNARMTLDQRGNGCAADLFVPVWTSQLFVHEWLRQSEPPITVTLGGGASQLATVQNHLARDLSDVHIAFGDRIYSLKSLPAGKTITTTLSSESGTALSDFATAHGSLFSGVVQGRRQAFGRQSGRLDNGPFSSMAASFGLWLSGNANPGQAHFGEFIFQDGFDLSADLRRGSAVLLAWDEGGTPVDPINRFKPVRSQRNTLYRVVIPSRDAASPDP